jgi:hypothetical protein
LFWCAVAAATLWAMDAAEALVVLAAGLLALWPALPGTRYQRTNTERSIG